MFRRNKAPPDDLPIDLLMFFSDFSLLPTAEYKTLCPGGEGFRPNPITVILEGQMLTFDLEWLRHGNDTLIVMFYFFLWQTSMSVRNCRACVKEESASTPLGAFSVNVQEVTHSTKRPESVKVSNDDAPNRHIRQASPKYCNFIGESPPKPPKHLAWVTTLLYIAVIYWCTSTPI